MSENAGLARRSLAGNVIVLTGAGRGIGRDGALALAREGAVVHVSDMDLAAAEGVATEIIAAGGRAFAHQCDVSDESGVESMLRDCAHDEGRIDVLVANAGIYPRLEFASTTTDDYDRVMNVNMKGVFLCTMHALPFMRERGGSIIAMSSGAGTLASIATPTARSLPLYGAAKAAVDRWVLGVAHELAELGIAANVLYPGAFVRTRGLEALGLSDAEMAATVTPEFVAPAMVWLAAERVGGICGQLVKASEFGTAWGPVSTAG
jgi:NAD(P)-dependent dehydrogenase (short-subunit alcohol dehydrogenase family)